MSRALATVDRLLFFLLGVILIVLGLWPILMHFDVGFANQAAEWVNHDVWGSLSEQSWWGYVLAGTAVVAFILGLWIIVANSRPHRFNKLTSSASNDEGQVTMSMNPIAGGIASALENLDGVETVDRRVTYDRKRPTIAYTVISSAEKPLAELRAEIEQCESDFRLAFPEMDVDTTYKLHYSKPKAR